MDPSFNAIIEPFPEEKKESEVKEEVFESEVKEILKPTRQHAFREEKYEPMVSSQEQYDPKCLFQALGLSFLTGSIVGAVLVYAFSRTSTVE